MAQFIQFAHPGPEARPTSPGFVEWNRTALPNSHVCDDSTHRRKFLQAKGTWLKDEQESNKVSLWLWGEWEPESEQLQNSSFLPGTDRGMPQFLWKPYWIPKQDYQGHHNTDPCVFGGFYYAICKQTTEVGQRLRYLPTGSVIIFGSLLGGEWVVDTVFVVSGRRHYHVHAFDEMVTNQQLQLPDGRQFQLPDGLKEVVFKSIRNSGVKPVMSFYVGATFRNQVEGMYSFFPCVPAPHAGNSSSGFKRPAIELDTKYFNPGLGQGTLGNNNHYPQGEG